MSIGGNDVNRPEWFFNLPAGLKIAIVAIVAIILLAFIALGTFPVGWARGEVERRLSEAFDAPVEIGAVTRDSFFSFSPEIAIHDARIGQPEWVGEGDFVKVARASARIPVFSLLGGNLSIRSLQVSGLQLALVRDANGKSNWSGKTDKDDDDDHNPFALERLIVKDSSFSLKDAKRRLDVSGDIAADTEKGLSIIARGTFDGAPARLTAGGDRIVKGSEADWPFNVRLQSDLLDLTVRGTMAGALNTRDMRLDAQAKAPSLKELDYLIEAGLFGTQDIDITAKVRHKGRDWFIDDMEGTIGRSSLKAKASVLKRDGRTKIDGDIHSAGFDFDDLADDAGLARGRAKQARIGPRVIPDTRIDLSNMGPTDGTIRFVIDRLLIEGGSAFRSMKGELSLDHRVLRADNVVVGLESGEMTGWINVDSTREMPVLSTELRVTGTSLETLIGAPDMISGQLRGLVRITGRGKTVREAFANGDGKIAFVAGSGSMNAAAAYVMGQNLGGAIQQGLRNRRGQVPLRCAVLSFNAAKGVLSPAPLAIDTSVSTGSGTGRINLDGETVSIALNGASKGRAALQLVDPIRVGGTLSRPAITIDNSTPEEGQSSHGILRSIGRSIGNALGVRDEEQRHNPTAPAINCQAMTAAALR